MKTLYVESKGEEDQQDVEATRSSRSDASGPKDGTSEFRAMEEEVVVEEVTE